MKRIIVIEDETVLLKNIVEMLELGGFEVAVRKTGNGDRTGPAAGPRPDYL